ncbi:hypothetical protein [Acidomonas methanolica]|uniref:Uncharacterized protein n=1 Tax=Acidomonas methanolica NBRC 104435 TaxID=1231351 RepID=A0A023D4B6_ACIMT|nr:hypothetical protein [Acidomonas methanolica]TCS31696.1 hypothetical protein EDC31_102248 [Acidomonas methanolica]GAJ28909.1 hypothetical protein Amme_038_158 [Acidomonas methanolica NBRC 104435]GEK98113.1 hypothetical protein AME01nite_06120 [Acidomonas methanolica NBRC 104435]
MARKEESFVGWGVIGLLALFGFGVAAVLVTAMANGGPALEFIP